MEKNGVTKWHNFEFGLKKIKSFKKNIYMKYIYGSKRGLTHLQI